MTILGPACGPNLYKLMQVNEYVCDSFSVDTKPSVGAKLGFQKLASWML